MKYLISVVLLILNCYEALPQSKHEIDSLYNALAHSTSDSARAKIYSDLCFQYRFFNTDSALQFGKIALELSRKSKFLRGEVAALSNSAFVLRDIGSFPESLSLQLEALRIAEENHFDSAAGLAMIRLAAVYRDVADYSKAIQYLRRSFEKNEKAKFQRGIVLATTNLGATFSQMNNLDSALYYSKKAERLIDSLKPMDLFPSVYRNLGEIYKKMHQNDIAMHYFNLSFKRSGMALGDNRAVSGTYLNTISGTFINMAAIYQAAGDMDSCIYYAQQSLICARLISSKLGIRDAASMLSKIYEPIDLKKSFEYLKVATAANDSLYSPEKFQALNSMTFEKEERDRNIELEKKAYQNRVRFIALMAGLLVFLFVALILYRNNRQKQKANKILEKALADLKSTQAQLIQSEKMASLGELTAGIAHEIQNPLNFVNNFTEVNRELLDELKTELDKGNISEAKIAAQNIGQNLEKVNQHGKRADSIVKGMLQHSRTSSGQKELTDINILTDEYLRLSYHGFRAKEKSFNAMMETEFDPAAGKINLIPQDIGRVFLNMFNNAFYSIHKKQKTAVNGYMPILKVTTRRTTESIEIKVIDNGVGIDEKIKDKIFQPFFTTKPTGEGTGLGLSLSYDVVRAHGGQLIVETTPDKSTAFVIKLPVT